MKPRELGLITIGQIHPRSLDAEGAEFNWNAGWPELTMTFREPSPKEQQAVESGTFEVALNVIDQVPFLCFRIFQIADADPFGQRKPATLILPWQECPIHLVQIHPDRLPAFDAVLQNPEFSLPMAAVLTDLETGRVRAVQQFILSAFLSRSLVEALLSTFPCYTPVSYPAAVDRIFANYPLNSIGETARIRCRSGT